MRTGLRKRINIKLGFIFKKATLVCFTLVALSTTSLAEIRIYTYTLKQPFGGSQSPDDARIAAIAKAKREVLEKAGTYLETLTVVKEYKVTKDEVIALAAGVLKAEIVSQENYATKDAFGIIVVTKVDVDTSILEKRVKNLLQNQNREDREKYEKYRESQRRESQLLAKIRELEEENKTLRNMAVHEQERKRKDIRKQFHQTAKGLTAVDLVREAVSILDTNPGRAEALLNEAVIADPKNAEAYYYLGRVYTFGKDFHKAIKAYEKAIDLAPSSPDAYFNLGFLYYSSRDYVKAEEMFQRVVDLRPVYLDEALFNLAVVQNLLGKRKVSIRNLELTLEINPNNDRARKYLLRLKRDSSHQSKIQVFNDGVIDWTQGKISAVGIGAPCSTVKDKTTEAATAYIAAFAVSLRNYFELRNGVKVSRLGEGIKEVSVRGELGDFKIYGVTTIKDYEIVSDNITIFYKEGMIIIKDFVLVSPEVSKINLLFWDTIPVEVSGIKIVDVAFMSDESVEVTIEGPIT